MSEGASLGEESLGPGRQPVQSSCSVRVTGMLRAVRKAGVAGAESEVVQMSKRQRWKRQSQGVQEQVTPGPSGPSKPLAFTLKSGAIEENYEKEEYNRPILKGVTEYSVKNKLKTWGESKAEAEKAGSHLL